jgi:hypothetical protein
MKGNCSQGAIPLGNMWCIQTVNAKIEIAIDENAIIL